MLKKVCFILLSSYCLLVASVIPSGKTKVIQIYSFPTNEAVLFKIENPIDECTGYFITKSDIGFDANLSMVLSAYHSKNKLVIHGVPEILFSGSSAKYCKASAIHFL
ncbi:hypothetical protein [Arcobacter sp. LA11]|uniref:hypothetical protein n=1 Tax=Arcobacter sp. LA11 TaxID=1898176 RepID=UPI000934C249|nr:hypothetical protein [Arcobacter sp. LA11]